MGARGDSTAEAPVKADEVRAQLERILASPAFSASVRRARLLRYLTERGLSGDGERVNEYAIGVDVFDKPASFDPRLESTVRSEFSRLRQKLNEYYETDGRADRILIEFPRRSYVPALTFLEPAPRLTARRRLWVVLAAVLSICAVSIAGWKVRARWHPTNSIVVLPFINLSPDRNDDYVADGLTEELTNDLTQSKDLRVVARTSASLFKGKAVDVREVGRKLNVDAAIEGSYERQGERARITAQMIRTADGYHVWSHSYEAAAKDVLDVQRQISQSIASAISGSDRKNEREAMSSTRDPEAHALYLKGRYELSRNSPESTRNALALFEQATQKDSTYANAWLGIAQAEWEMAHASEKSYGQAAPRERAAAERALQLNPSLGAAHAVLGNLLATDDRDWPRAEAEFRKAIADGAQGARSPYGTLLAIHGRFREAEEQFRIAQDFDPLNPNPHFNQFLAYYLAHDYAAAKRALHEVLELNPNRMDAHYMLGATAFVEHDCAEVSTQFEWCARRVDAPTTKIGLALEAACGSQNDKARAYLEAAQKANAQGFASPYQLAVGYAAIRDGEKALALLERSADAKEMQILYLTYDQLFDSLRGDPRFEAIKSKVGLK
jgi:serine/threonine-protein kinase